MNESKFVLYTYVRSTASMRVRLALDLKGISYDTIEVNLLKNEQKNQEYLFINPNGSVPCLEWHQMNNNDTLRIKDSMSILEFLETFRSKCYLIPRDPYEAAISRDIAHIITADVHPIQNLRVLNAVEAIGGNRKAWAQDVIIRGFTAIENILLTDHTYCVGQQLTIADVCLAPQYLNALRYGVDVKQFPKITKVVMELVKIPEFQFVKNMMLDYMNM